jgi:hypothetical protein
VRARRALSSLLRRRKLTPPRAPHRSLACSFLIPGRPGKNSNSNLQEGANVTLQRLVGLTAMTLAAALLALCGNTRATDDAGREGYITTANTVCARMWRSPRLLLLLGRSDAPPPRCRVHARVALRCHGAIVAGGGAHAAAPGAGADGRHGVGGVLQEQRLER